MSMERGIFIVMADIQVTVKTIERIFACRIEKVGVTSIDGQSYREKVLMAVKAGFS